MSDKITLTIELTTAELKALAYVARDPQEWAENAIKERARHAMMEIFDSEVRRMLQDPSVVEIPADIEAVVLAANVLSVAERMAIAQQDDEAGLPQ